ncbi:ogr/Delta-like zinc finger family protein [Rosenbergiella nectarea]|uniref:ogr/Delta-like zinc finger family protein n=1 Tax=Rosenbergiella nectarea TaxID=988801 RepID=UPI001F4D9527|nr:ogr/Delta-like zinc finger family protein [Rosenbergiella nectarea]
MMNCPECGQAAHTRSSFRVSERTKERYCQCQNINCRATFVTHETFVRFIATPTIVNHAAAHPQMNGQGSIEF